MKTNKEIKPFKMRVTETQSIKVRGVLLLKYNYKEYGYEETHPFILVNSSAHKSTIQSGWNESKFGLFEVPELTYSEFMKLYGEEEEVFTREDMKAFAYYVLQTAAMGTENECDRLLTKFLSERTND